MIEASLTLSVFYICLIYLRCNALVAGAKASELFTPTSNLSYKGFMYLYSIHGNMGLLYRDYLMHAKELENPIIHLRLKIYMHIECKYKWDF